jgi:alanyl-tRNA synthetase
MCCAGSCAAPCATPICWARNEPLMHRLAPTLVAEMGDAYPELRRAEAAIVDTLRQEEERFRRTLGRGMSLLDEATEGLAEGGVMSGEAAFMLYDTYGFPLDLTQDAVRAKGLTVDTRRLRRRHDAPEGTWRAPPGPARARPPRPASGSPSSERLGPTDFIGYENVETTAELLRHRARTAPRPIAPTPARPSSGPVRPHALLRRRRRPGGRQRVRSNGTVAAAG